MTYNLLFEAVLQASMSWPLNAPIKGPKCVTAVDVPGDLVSPPPYEAYLAGHFWNKDWVAKGARPSDISLARPLLGIERKRTIISLSGNKDSCSEVWITLVDDPCNVPDCKVEETTEQLTRRLLDTLTELVRRLMSWQLWKLADGSVTIFNPLIPGAVAPVGGVYTKIPLFEGEETDIRVTDLTDEVALNKGRSVAVGLTVCGCIPMIATTDFVGYTRPPGLGETKCELC